MAQQWLANTIRDAFRDRSDAPEQAAEAARLHAWLESLPLDRATVAVLVEPVAALEDGLHQAARDHGTRPVATEAAPLPRPPRT